MLEPVPAMDAIDRTYLAYKPTYRKNWDTMKIRPSFMPQINLACRKILSEKVVFLKCEAATGVPWWFHGIVLMREADFDINSYIGNGQSLRARTTIVPIGRGPFPNFVAGDIDAMRIQGYLRAHDWSIERTSYRDEKYNGLGYHRYGIPSPYLYNGSTIYGPPDGKFIDDGRFAYVRDTQLGTLPVLKRLMELDKSIVFADAPVPQPTPQPEPAPIPEPDDIVTHGVLWVQQTLNKIAHAGLIEDGCLGKRTMTAVRRYQIQHGVKPYDGLPGPKTIAELEKDSGPDSIHLGAQLITFPKLHSSVIDFMGECFQNAA